MRKETEYKSLPRFHRLVRDVSPLLGITKLKDFRFHPSICSDIWNGKPVSKDIICRLVQRLSDEVENTTNREKKQQAVKLLDKIAWYKDRGWQNDPEVNSQDLFGSEGGRPTDHSTFSSNLAGDGASVPDKIAAPEFLKELRAYKKRQLNSALKKGDIGAQRDCLHLLAMLAKDLEDWQDTIHMIQQSVSLCQRIEDRVAEGTLRNDLAWAQYRGYQWEAAVQNLHLAESLWKDLGAPDKRQLSRTYDYQAINLRVLAKHQNAFEYLDKAERLLRTSLEIRRSLKVPLGVATTLHRLGRVSSHQAYRWLRSGNVSKFDGACRVAAESFQEARKCRLQYGHHLDYTRTTILFVRHLTTVGAQDHKSQISDMLKEAIEVSNKNQLHETFVQATINKARFERKTNQVDKANGTLNTLTSGIPLSKSDQAQKFEEYAKIAGVMNDKEAHDRLWSKASKLWRGLRNDKGADSAASRITHAF